MKQTESITAFV